MNLRKDHYRCLLSEGNSSLWQIITFHVTRLSPAGPGRRRATLGVRWRSPSSLGVSAAKLSVSARSCGLRRSGPRTSLPANNRLSVRVPVPVASRWPGRASLARSNEHRWPSTAAGAALAKPPLFILLLSLTFMGKPFGVHPGRLSESLPRQSVRTFWLRPRDNSKRWITRLVCR